MSAIRIGMPLNYASGFHETVEELREFEAVGLDRVLLPEAYTFDAVSQLGFIAARTSTLELCTSILNIYSRTPSLLAMTAAGIDYVSGGRCVLGIGSSGPQVVEGFHGVPYDSPLARTREVVEICRQVWRRERVEHDGRFYHLPLTREQGGTGLGKPLKLINTPLRADIPIVLAALGPRNIELAAQLCEGWSALFYLPESAGAAFGPALAAGKAKRDPQLPPLDIMVSTKMLVSDDADEIAQARQTVREELALYVGGMGARDKNFYAQMAIRYGFEHAVPKIQDLFLSGHKAEAAAAVPEEFVRGVSLIGPAGHVRERVAAFVENGVTTLSARSLGKTHDQRVKDVARLKEYAS